MIVSGNLMTDKVFATEAGKTYQFSTNCVPQTAQNSQFEGLCEVFFGIL
jgi:hypothetical protein